MVKVAVLFTAGTNCDSETVYAFELAGAKADTVHINQLKSKKKSLSNYTIMAIPGGFTYGDYIAAGRILATELKYNLREVIEKFIEAGKLIIGLCNGFQVLVKAGILPGIPTYFSDQTITLDANDSNRYEDRWIYLKNMKGNRCIFTKGIDPIIHIPVAHAEGKFIPKDKKILKQLKTNNQIVFTYVNEKGEKAGYPYNPNGSIENIAGICDQTGRVFGLMPHPERFLHPQFHPHWHREHKIKPQGQFIFKNAVNYVRKNL